MKVNKRHREEASRIWSESNDPAGSGFGPEAIAEALAAAEHRGASTRALELWAMDVLTAWAKKTEAWWLNDFRGSGSAVCDLEDMTDAPRRRFEGATTGEAMIAAARALKAAHPELPDEPKETT